ncbi:DUF547 domain-containing protein [Hymenobacter sp. BT491]|uniref:DUF547 domain-containing protein n=1 Tax=Hymenobacter sp. BT491 TaxID=2766779 RepID=UPI001653C45D|nr:DUF547 domain-containing protein [Hymenobacter sp. BT491]MBC6988458.1 DUF547 domain-containing protein [Hymenobacter sp. BT491]
MHTRKCFRLVLLLLVCLLIPGLGKASEATTHQALHQAWDELLTKHVSRDGKVDYQGFIDDEGQLQAYLHTLAQNAPDETTWPAAEVKAYWINIYNAATINLIVQYYEVDRMNEIRIKTLKGYRSPWDTKEVRVGKKWYSLNEIERQILGQHFRDPRVHFALVCAAAASPTLLNEAYTATGLEKQLDDQVRYFLADHSRNQLAHERIQVSSLFNWYAAEFGEGESLIAFLNRYAPIRIEPTAQVDFLPFDWSLNAQQPAMLTQAMR